MNEYLFLIPISIALLLGVISPGPSFIIVAQIALQKTRKHAIYTSLGLGLGAMLITLFSSFGIFLLLKSTSFVYEMFKLLGGLYLAYLAYKIWVNSNNKLDENIEIENDKTYYKSFIIGLVTQLSNPKTSLIISGIILAFLPSEVPSYTYLLLALIAFIIDASWYLTVAIVLSTKKAQIVYLRYASYINKSASFLMTYLALKLIFNF